MEVGLSGWSNLMKLGFEDEGMKKIFCVSVDGECESRERRW